MAAGKSAGDGHVLFADEPLFLGDECIGLWVNVRVEVPIGIVFQIAEHPLQTGMVVGLNVERFGQGSMRRGRERHKRGWREIEKAGDDVVG